jgi:heme/copper-type cytochrome/quinol oxidase subunit 3
MSSNSGMSAHPDVISAHDEHFPHTKLGADAHAAEVLDAAHHGHTVVENNFLGLPNIKLAMWAFLGSECMFFGSLIGTYFFYHGNSLSGPLPKDVFSIGITSISTFLLLMSSLTMALGVDAMKQQKPKVARMFILMTAALGATFVGFQVVEFHEFYTEKHLIFAGPNASLFGSTFYTMTGFHGTHVTVGVIWLLIMSVLITKNKLKPGKEAVNVEVMGLYWHFVDIVWIIIFTFVYLLEFLK